MAAKATGKEEFERLLSHRGGPLARNKTTQKKGIVENILEDPAKALSKPRRRAANTRARALEFLERDFKAPDSDARIPKYEPLLDPHCDYTDSPAFRKRLEHSFELSPAARLIVETRREARDALWQRKRKTFFEPPAFPGARTIYAHVPARVDSNRGAFRNGAPSSIVAGNADPAGASAAAGSGNRGGGVSGGGRRHPFVEHRDPLGDAQTAAESQLRKYKEILYGGPAFAGVKKGSVADSGAPTRDELEYGFEPDPDDLALAAAQKNRASEGSDPANAGSGRRGEGRGGGGGGGGGGGDDARRLSGKDYADDVVEETDIDVEARMVEVQAARFAKVRSKYVNALDPDYLYDNFDQAVEDLESWWDALSFPQSARDRFRARAPLDNATFPAYVRVQTQIGRLILHGRKVSALARSITELEKLIMTLGKLRGADPSPEQRDAFVGLAAIVREGIDDWRNSGYPWDVVCLWGGENYEKRLEQIIRDNPKWTFSSSIGRDGSLSSVVSSEDSVASSVSGARENWLAARRRSLSTSPVPVDDDAPGGGQGNVRNRDGNNNNNRGGNKGGRRGARRANEPSPATLAWTAFVAEEKRVQMEEGKRAGVDTVKDWLERENLERQVREEAEVVEQARNAAMRKLMRAKHGMQNATTGMSVLTKDVDGKFHGTADAGAGDPPDDGKAARPVRTRSGTVTLTSAVDGRPTIPGMGPGGPGADDQQQSELLRRFEYELEFQLELERRKKELETRRRRLHGLPPEGGAAGAAGGAGSGPGSSPPSRGRQRRGLSNSARLLGSTTSLLPRAGSGGAHVAPHQLTPGRGNAGDQFIVGGDVETGMGIARSGSSSNAFGAGADAGAGISRAESSAKLVLMARGTVDDKGGLLRMSDVHMRLLTAMRYRELVQTSSQLSAIREMCLSELAAVAPAGTEIDPRRRSIRARCDLLATVTLRLCSELSSLAAEFPHLPFFHGHVRYADKIVHDTTALAAAGLVRDSEAASVAAAVAPAVNRPAADVLAAMDIDEEHAAAAGINTEDGARGSRRGGRRGGRGAPGRAAGDAAGDASDAAAMRSAAAKMKRAKAMLGRAERGDAALLRTTKDEAVVAREAELRRRRADDFVPFKLVNPDSDTLLRLEADIERRRMGLAAVVTDRGDGTPRGGGRRDSVASSVTSAGGGKPARARASSSSFGPGESNPLLPSIDEEDTGSVREVHLPSIVRSDSPRAAAADGRASPRGPGGRRGSTSVARATRRPSTLSVSSSSSLAAPAPAAVPGAGAANKAKAAGGGGGRTGARPPPLETIEEAPAAPSPGRAVRETSVLEVPQHMHNELAFRTAEVVIADMVATAQGLGSDGKSGAGGAGGGLGGAGGGLGGAGGGAITDRIPASAIVITERQANKRGGKARANIEAPELFARDGTRLVPLRHNERAVMRSDAAEHKLAGAVTQGMRRQIAFPGTPRSPLDAVREAKADVEWSHTVSATLKRTGRPPLRSTSDQTRAAIRLTTGLDTNHRPI